MMTSRFKEEINELCSLGESITEDIFHHRIPTVEMPHRLVSLIAMFVVGASVVLANPTEEEVRHFEKHILDVISKEKDRDGTESFIDATWAIMLSLRDVVDREIKHDINAVKTA